MHLPPLLRSPSLWLAAASAALVLGLPDPGAAEANGCPDGMASIRGRYCIDRYEAGVVELVKGGKTRKHSPYEPVGKTLVKAVVERGVVPQGYISRNQAELACRRAGKRLCTDTEWVVACKGKRPTKFPYGEERVPGRCNDKGRSSFNKYYGEGGKEAPKEAYTYENMNDPRLNKLKGTLAPTGKFRKCKNSFGLYDMVGNLHEWTADPAGTFRGGYYLDAVRNKHGCDYRTTAHSPSYHDYSTGFRCCR